MLRITGSGSKNFYANATCSHTSSGKKIETLSGLGLLSDIWYEPTELVVTASAATPLKVLAQLLQQSHQYLPFDPPFFGPDATVGGMVASGFSGPSRASVGCVRDYVLGVHLINGKGEYLEFGGQVMKNVAGYDVSRLLVGSFGQIGLITQVSLKVLPVPVAQACLVLECTQDQAITKLNHWAGLPLPVRASCWVQDQGNQHLYLHLAGAQAAVLSATKSMGGSVLDWASVEQDWTALREQTLGFFQLEPGQYLWRVSLPDTCPALPHHYPTLLEWGAALRWIKAPFSAFAGLQKMVLAQNGQMVLWRAASQEAVTMSDSSGPDSRDYSIKPYLSPVQLRIQTQLLQQLDPLGVFQTERLL